VEQTPGLGQYPAGRDQDRHVFSAPHAVRHAKSRGQHLLAEIVEQASSAELVQRRIVARARGVVVVAVDDENLKRKSGLSMQPRKEAHTRAIIS